MNILQWKKGGKLFLLEGLHVERETREREELKKWEKNFMLTNEDQASLNS